MILFVTTAEHRYTLKKVSNSRGGRSAVRAVSYDWLFRQSRIRAACVVFTDFDRLRHHELKAAAAIYRQLRAGGMKVLNDPARAKQRFALLQALHAAGVNRLQAYPAAARPRPARFPVFIKCTANHAQDFNRLIENQDGLDRALTSIEAEGTPLRDLLVIEFANAPIREGTYLRKTIFRVGERMLSGNPVIEDSPFVKYGRAGLATDEEFARLCGWMRDNPDLDALEQVFAIAGIDYGRADFGTDGGGIAVYEINTNPTVGNSLSSRSTEYRDAMEAGFKAVVEAIHALGGETHTVRLRHDKGWFSRLRFKAGFFLRMP